MRSLITVPLLLSFASCSQIKPTEPGSVRVDAGGHQLEFLVQGIHRGQPTVILESGLGGSLASWTDVRQSLAKVTRVVSYNRAGGGGSQPGPRPRTASRIVQELRTALRNLGISPPYVLVGHSIGGLYVRNFAAAYPDEVAALVLADPTMEFRESLTESQVHARLKEHWGAQYHRIESMLGRIHPKMSDIAAQSLLGLEPYLSEIPPSEQEAARELWLDTFADRSQQIEGMLVLMSDAERQELFASMQSMRAMNSLTETTAPVTLLISAKPPADSDSDGQTQDPTKSADYIAWSQTARQRRYAEFLETIPDGQMMMLPDSGHNIPRDRPDAIVESVLEYLSASASTTSTSTRP